MKFLNTIKSILGFNKRQLAQKKIPGYSKIDGFLTANEALG
jgi:hypothetical protein